jgi:magnesium and cobalt transporter
MNKEETKEETHNDLGAGRGLLERLTQAIVGGPTTHGDLIALLRDAQERGVVERDALDMIEGALATADMKVRDIMVPRAQMDVVDKNEPPERYLPHVIATGHSRFPVVDGDKDKVVGILLAKDLLRYFQLDKKSRAQFDLHDMLRPAVFVPESKRLNVLLREFKASRNHMAIVVDEYGGVAGLVTIEDVLEQIVGEIKDELDVDIEEGGIAERAPGEFVVKALTPLEEFNERFKTAFTHGEIETVGGFVAARFGHVPGRGETIALEGFRFEVLRADSRRIHLLKVTPAAETGNAAANSE